MEPYPLPFDPTHFRKLAEQGIQKNVKSVFTEIYQTNHWGGEKSVSGEGSDNEQTAVLQKVLPKLLKKLSISHLLDLPCGDFGWLSQLDPGVQTYTGGDIVGELIHNNQLNHQGPGRSFQVLDLLSSPLPKADIILCRDCLVHLSYADISRALANLRESGIPYLLTTTFPARQENQDITTGDWRTLNLEAAPFYFPTPLQLINEGCTEGGGAFTDKSMGLWRVNDLPAF